MIWVTDRHQPISTPAAEQTRHTTLSTGSFIRHFRIVSFPAVKILARGRLIVHMTERGTNGPGKYFKHVDMKPQPGFCRTSKSKGGAFILSPADIFVHSMSWSISETTLHRQILHTRIRKHTHTHTTPPPPHTHTHLPPPPPTHTHAHKQTAKERIFFF